MGQKISTQLSGGPTKSRASGSATFWTCYIWDNTHAHTHRISVTFFQLLTCLSCLSSWGFTTWCPWCPYWQHTSQTHSLSWWQNRSRGRWCCEQVLASTVGSGGYMLLWSGPLCGKTSRYVGIEGGAEEEADEGLCLMLLVLSFSIASMRTVLLASEGRGLKTCLHWGQLYWPLVSFLSQWLWIQAKQYECPQDRVAGSFSVSRQTEHTNVSSSVQADAIWKMSLSAQWIDSKALLCLSRWQKQEIHTKTARLKCQFEMKRIQLKT